MNPRVQFEDEADAEYRLAGRYYEEHILELPRAGTLVPRMPEDLPVRRRAVTRLSYHVVYVDAGTNIRILAIAHDHRKPGYWEGRLKRS